MADLTKLKRRSSLGEPPPLAEASANLEAPETPPVVPTPVWRMTVVRPAAARAGEGTRRQDRDHKLLVEVLEEALEAYENSRSRHSSR